MADFLTEKRREINARLSELKPLVEEYRQLEQVAQALEGVGGTGTGNGRRRGPGRPRGSRTTTRARAGARRGRRRGGNTRAAQALALVKGKPGITIPELAKSMGIKQNYLYRVMPGLESDGQVRRKGKGWHPK